MAITLTTAFLNELNENSNVPCVVIEIALDSGSIKLGTHPSFSDILPALRSVSSLQNKLDPKSGYSTRGQITATIIGRENFTGLIQDEYLKNRRVVRKDGFIAAGFLYSDYAGIFTGKIIDWSRKGDELTLVIGDDMQTEGGKKIPVEKVGNTQTLDFRNTNPVDIVQSVLKTHMGISASIVDDTQFDLEQSLWLSGWVFDRVLTKPTEANKILNELQIETNSFIVHDGEKISFKHFAPPTPGQTIEEWSDDYHVLENTFSQKSGYKDQFYNRIIIYFDYMESGNDKAEDFESAYISIDASSGDSSEWDGTKTKTIKSKWIRSLTYSQPTSITGVTLYHVSVGNGAGSGELTYNKNNNTLSWEAPGGGGIAGATITLDKDGTYQLFHTNLNKWIRIVVDISALPASDKTDVIEISTLDGESYAAYLANKLLARYRDPSSTVSFSIDINNVAHDLEFIKPTDLKDLTTAEASEKGKSTWSKERLMLTSVRPDFSGGKVQIEAIQTRMYKKYGFIAPAGQADWNLATEAEKEYCFVGDASNQLGTANTEGFVVW